MKIAALISRYLMGLIFLIFGLNGFLMFIPMGPPPTGVTGQFLGALMQSHYSQVVSAIQLIGALLLLSNQYVPLALTILAPVIVNIFLVHLLMLPVGLPLALVMVLLWTLVAVRYWSYFAPLLTRRADKVS